jgi:hypothetical protein
MERKILLDLDSNQKEKRQKYNKENHHYSFIIIFCLNVRRRFIKQSVHIQLKDGVSSTSNI